MCELYAEDIITGLCLHRVKGDVSVSSGGSYAEQGLEMKTRTACDIKEESLCCAETLATVREQIKKAASLLRCRDIRLQPPVPVHGDGHQGEDGR